MKGGTMRKSWFAIICVLLLSAILFSCSQDPKPGETWRFVYNNPFEEPYHEDVLVIDVKKGWIKYKRIENTRYPRLNGKIETDFVITFKQIREKINKEDN